MLTHHRRARLRLLQILDGCLFGVGMGAAYWLRSRFPFWNLPELQPFTGYLFVLAPLVMLMGPTTLSLQQFYARPAGPPPRLAEIGVLVRACILTVLGVILILFLVRQEFARSVVIMTGVFASALVYARLEITSWLDRAGLAREQLEQRVLWVGLPAAIAVLRERLSPDEGAFLRTAAEFDPRVGPPAAFPALLHEHAINLVIVTLAGLPFEDARPLLDACEREGVETIVHAGLFHTAVFRPELDRFAGEPVITYRPQPVPAWQLFIKRLIDYVGAGLMLTLLSPVLILIALAVRVSSPGPALFRQRRCGLNGRPFDLFKFRSMVRDAERQRGPLEARNEMKGPVFKVSGDPRVTPLGRFLRRHGLDELPQLWNILRGEMSLVGPRPLPVEEVHRFDNHAQRRRLSVLPGLTCEWQVRGRNDIDDFEEWVRLDLEYIDHWSLWLDGRILLATVPAVILGRGGR